MMSLNQVAGESVGHVVGTIGTEGFASSFQGYALQRLGVSRCHVFSFSERNRPTCVLARSKSAGVSKAAQALASDYIGGDYHSDPMLRRLKPAQGLWITNEYPREMRPGYFREKYYQDSHLAEEVSVLGRVRERLIYAGFCRQEEETPFSDLQFQTIQDDAPVIVNAIARHLELESAQRVVAAPAVQTSDFGSAEERRRVFFVKVRDALLDCRRSVTPREAEICAYIAQGYFVEAIAQMLGISANTVSTHRKRAYRKLGISRQNELFARYINFLT